jgi:DNA-binding transcriptional ArsR family regulator
MMNEIQAAADIAKVLADPLRLKILQCLTWGPAQVADLVVMVGSTQPNVSNHLRVMRDKAMVLAEKNGRHTVYRVASPAIAELIAALSWAAIGKDAPAELRLSGELAEARTCYDHLGGSFGVRLFESLRAAGAITSPRSEWADVELGPNAKVVLGRLGIDIEKSIRSGTRRRLAFACPDWTEHGHSHLGGLLGAVICSHCMEVGWTTQNTETRAVTVTPVGLTALEWLMDQQMQQF